jgi:amino acid transporter
VGIVAATEEAENPHRTIPYAILGAVIASALLYVGLSATVVLADRGGDIALWRIQRRQARVAGTFAVPGRVPPVAASTTDALMLAELTQ